MNEDYEENGWQKINDGEREIFYFQDDTECRDKGAKCAECENRLKCITGQPTTRYYEDY